LKSNAASAPSLNAALAPARKFVVYPGQGRYRVAPDIEVLSLEELTALVTAA